MSTAADAPRGSPRRSGGRSMRTFLMTWLWALVAVYVLVTLLMFLAQRSLIYPADAIAPQIADQGLAELRAIVTEPEPRSEERRGGEGCVSKGRTRGVRFH